MRELRTRRFALALPRLALGCLFVAASFGQAKAADPVDAEVPAERATLEVTWLANASFLVSAGGPSVLIDAFVREPYSQYSAVPESVLTAMKAGASPFDGVVVALVSHAHRDHHQPDVAREFFAVRPEVAFASSAEVRSLTFPDAGDADRVVSPARGESEFLEIDGVRVEFLGLTHAGSGQGSVGNLGHVISVGGRRVLHLGDAEQDPDLFAALDLPSRDLDVALVPYWHLRQKSGRMFLDEHIGADWYVAYHVPPADLAEVTKRLVMRMPDLRVPARPLETFRY
jgi:L-ascorbate metabolism protein UlaG (beta-lactamase superfamily)